MAAANPLWRAPRIHGELKMLGIEISERTVSEFTLLGLQEPGIVDKHAKNLMHQIEPCRHWHSFTAQHTRAELCLLLGLRTHEANAA